jgi:inhibitor of cysteine peptidase
VTNTALSQIDNGKSISLAMGEMLTLSLTENPTTGYRWQLDSPKGGVLRIADDKFQPVGGQVGGSGIRTLSLVAAEKGSYRLSLSLKRAWETPESGIEEFTLQLNVL